MANNQLTRSSPISQDEINSILWKACDTFRGTLDPSEYKNYILIMQFVKYISDVRQDYFDQFMLKYKGDETRVRRQLDKDKFKVPDGARFEKLYAQRNESNHSEITNEAGFVEMASLQDGENAIRMLNGLKLKFGTRPIVIKFNKEAIKA